MFKNNNLRKLTTLALMSALGVVLMLVDFSYPLAPFLKIEFSDLMVLIAFSVFGFKEALLVGILKALGDLLFQGATGPYAIGQITALCASISYVVGFYLVNKLIPSKIKYLQILKYIIVICFVCIIMTFLNYIIVTPIFLNQGSVFTIKNWSALGYKESYLVAIIFLYVPFNLIKGLCVMTSYFLVGEQVVTVWQVSEKEGD